MPVKRNYEMWNYVVAFIASHYRKVIAFDGRTRWRHFFCHWRNKHVGLIIDESSKEIKFRLQCFEGLKSESSASS